METHCRDYSMILRIYPSITEWFRNLKHPPYKRILFAYLPEHDVVKIQKNEIMWNDLKTTIKPYCDDIYIGKSSHCKYFGRTLIVIESFRKNKHAFICNEIDGKLCIDGKNWYYVRGPYAIKKITITDDVIIC